MKKIIINEDWEEVEVPDLSNFFVLIFKQGSDKAGYIKCYDTDETPVFTEYDNLVNQYSNVKFEEPTSINVIKVPATGQVKAMLEETPYNGDETNKDKIETINHLLGRADCECLKEKVLMSLEEAKELAEKHHVEIEPHFQFGHIVNAFYEEFGEKSIIPSISSRLYSAIKCSRV